MANFAIFDLHPAELENEIIALTDDEQASIEGGSKTLVRIATYLKKKHDEKGKWYSFL